MFPSCSDRIRLTIAPLAAVAILTIATCGTTLAQSSVDLDLTVVDARGTAWDVSGGDVAIDLEGISDRRLELRAVPLVGGAASASVRIDGAAQLPVDLQISERELVTVATADVEEIVAASARDPLVWPAGFTYGSSSDLELGVDPPHGAQLVYVAFDDLAVAPGAEVVGAAVRFTSDGNSDGPLTLRVTAVTALPADAVLQDTEGSASGTLTAATTRQRSVEWIPDPSWSANSVYETPDLTALVAEAWGDPRARSSNSLGFLFSITDGDGTRRAYALEGRQASAPVLVLVVREPVATTIPIEVPAATSEVTVTLHSEPAGGGEPIAFVTFRVTTEAAAVPAPSEPAATPAPPETPAPAATPTPAETPAPAATPTPPETPAPAATPAVVAGEAAIWVADLDARDGASSLVTVVLREPVTTPVALALRFGTCTELGAVLTELVSVPVGDRGSTTVVPVSMTVLRLSGVVVALEGVPGACAPLRP